MKYGLHTDGRRMGPIDPAKVNETGWFWYDSPADLEAANPPTLAQAKAAKLTAINASYEIEAAVVKDGYPPSEVFTWDKQEKEAKAYSADPTASTPFVDALAAGRGIAKADLVNRILTKTSNAEAFLGNLTGKRQKLEDQINAATTVAEVNLIVW